MTTGLQFGSVVGCHDAGILHVKPKKNITWFVCSHCWMLGEC